MAQIYDIYHDESQEDSYWHGFLFVPQKEKKYLLKLLIKSRIGANWTKPISFKEIKKRMGMNSPRVQLVESWLTIGIVSLQQQKLFKLPTPFYLCGTSRCYFNKLDKLIKNKFVVFRERDRHKKMFYTLNELQCIETTFRMGIKGGVHKLFSTNEPIIIRNVFIDGNEHYFRKYGRDFDVQRSLRRFAMERKSYVQFTRDSKLIPQRSDDRKITPKQKSEDSQILQLCDILLGGIRFHSYCPDYNNIKHKISFPCKTILERDTNNYFRMKESRFLNAFTLSEAWLENDEWKFDRLKLRDDKSIKKCKQLKLSLNYVKKS